MTLSQPRRALLALGASVLLATLISPGASAEPDPAIASPSEHKPGYEPWDTVIGRSGAASARATQALAAAAPLVVDELEPRDLLDRNDTLTTAEHVTAPPAPSDVRIGGTLARPPISLATSLGPFAEDDGSIPLAGETGLGSAHPAVRIAGTIGDGPHGLRAGDATGDFDVFAITANAGQTLTADVDSSVLGSPLDAFVVLLDANATIVATNDDGPGFDSFLRADIPADGTYYVAVTAFGSLPTNPFDSGSGTGSRTEGDYEIELRFDFDQDVDVFAFDLAPGDVLGATVDGAGNVLGVFDSSGVQVMGSGRDISRDYPFDSPLPGGGNATADHVAAVAGRHSVMVSGGAGDYEVTLRRLRPGLEAGAPGERQIFFLDFDGAEFSGRIFNVPGIRTLSPMSAFMGGWGLGPDDEDALIDAMLATFEENLVHDPQALGGNTNFDVEIRNSRDHADPWGQPNVTRIIIGGTVAELGFTTVGVAESVDPGNLDQEETGVVLLDQASAPAGSGARTINDFITPGIDVVAFVGRTMGFVASHEAGHLIGNDHTTPNNGVVSIMDTFDLTQLGLGPDMVFGTEDDVDVDFVTDAYVGSVIGTNNSLNRVTFALTGSAVLSPPDLPDDVEATLTRRGARVTWTAPGTGDEPDGYVVRVWRHGRLVATEELSADRYRARFADLRPGRYVFTVAGVNAAGEGPAAESNPVYVGR